MKAREDLLLLYGKGKYLDDVRLPRTMYATIVRSPYAHARILGVDGTLAKRQEGVVDVIDGKALEGSYQPLNFGSKLVKGSMLRGLAVDKVRYVGEPVAVVLTRDKYAGEDAVGYVEVEYDPLPPIVTWEDALQAPALVHEPWGNNIAIDHDYESGNVAEAFATADHVLEETFRMHRHAGTPIETRGILAHYEWTSERLTVWSTSNLPHLYRTALSETLGTDESRIRVIAGNIGGAFGTKTVPNAEDMLIPLLAVRYDQPIKWVETRSENLKGLHGKEQVHQIRVAVRADGTILAIRDKIILDLGSFANRTGPVEGFNAACFVPGCYKVKNYAVKLVGVVTNKPPLGPYRGFGKSAPTFVIERVMDRVAKKLGLDVAEVRFKNLVTEFPHRNPAGAVYDSGSYKRSLELALERVGYQNFRKEQAEKRAAGEYLGIGISCSLDGSGHVVKDALISAFDGVTVRVSRRGSVTVLTGSCGLIGTRHETSFSEFVGKTLGVRPETVDVVEGDTLVCPIGQGSFSDRTAVYTMSAAKIASEKLRERILKLASAMTEVAAEELELRDGIISARNVPGLSLKISDVAEAVYKRTYSLPEGLAAGLEETHYFSLRDVEFFAAAGGTGYYPCFGNSCHVAVVKVDPETGKVRIVRYVMVHDAGRILNEKIVEGQALGGLVAGFGGALMEELVYDSNGQLESGTFMDYLIPNAPVVPREIEVYHLESPSPMTPVGSKGAGEAGANGSYGALANAVEDALEPFGVLVRDLPLKQEYLWRAINNSRSTVGGQE
ncbi:MAG: xanthine dehydrogenase family protein molybdopterin-binding subunit [Deltaproteobacteria bacterium]|nr:xanthine dehydrogenase family protein molybdopterin-binding subunit [Deltaproteobacteria bacterium]